MSPVTTHKATAKKVKSTSTKPGIKKKVKSKQPAPMKVVYIKVGQDTRTVHVQPQASLGDVRTLVANAAQLEGHHQHYVFKLVSQEGCLVGLGPSIPVNTLETPYTLSWKMAGKWMGMQSDGIEQPRPSNEQESLLQKDLEELNKKILLMKTKFLSLEPKKTSDTLKLNWLHPATKRVQKALEIKDDDISFTRQFSPQVLQEMKKPTFDVWRWNDQELICLFEEMFKEFNLISIFNLDTLVLRQFLNTVRKSYNRNPFHNFRHCFCVTQMAYTILNLSGLDKKLTDLEKFALLVACIGHDLDHPGSNNAYHINAGTEIATVYNDTSPLESHHAAVLFTILRQPSFNITHTLTELKYKEFRKDVINCILATDMGKHGEIVTKFKSLVETFNYEDESHRKLLMQIIIKCSDISNEVRPQSIADDWVNGLLNEFFSQFNKEKAENLPTAPFMDPSKVTKPGAQIGFIGFVMVPLFEALCKLVPTLEPTILQPVRDSLQYYKDQQAKLQQQHS